MSFLNLANNAPPVGKDLTEPYEAYTGVLSYTNPLELR